jgi:hypothetical protein
MQSTRDAFGRTLWCLTDIGPGASTAWRGYTPGYATIHRPVRPVAGEDSSGGLLWEDRVDAEGRDDDPRVWENNE